MRLVILLLGFVTGCVVGGGPTLVVGRQAPKFGFEGGGGLGPIQLTGGYTMQTPYVRADLTSMWLDESVGEEYSDSRSTGTGGRIGLGLGHDDGVRFIALAGVGGFHALKGPSPGENYCGGELTKLHLVASIVAGVTLIGRELAVFVNPRLEGQGCILSH